MSHQLEGLDQRGLVQLIESVCRTHLHQLGDIGRLRHRQPHGARAGEGQAEVLLVQRDPKAVIEGPLNQGDVSSPSTRRVVWGVEVVATHRRDPLGKLLGHHAGALGNFLPRPADRRASVPNLRPHGDDQ